MISPSPRPGVEPALIQGGMGVAVSSWPLARAVASRAHLGVVSGTALDVVLARRLQAGDPGGHLRRALDAFPDRDVAAEVLARFFVPGGRTEKAAFTNVPMFAAQPAPWLYALATVAGFAEVFLAKDGHDGPVGINFLEKVQLPTPAILYGALLADVDYLLVGAGIPRDFPDLLDSLTQHEPARLPLHVTGAVAEDDFTMTFDPARIIDTGGLAPLRRPRFLAIVSSATLAVSLSRHGGRVDGFVVEGPTAGGHNAPPRGAMKLNAAGEPTYGARDAVDLARMREIGLPFWLAGTCATPQGIDEARRQGAQGIQVGTLFAFCDESGMAPALRAEVLAQVRSGAARVITDPLASPTGFPFKVVQVNATLSDPGVYAARERRCDLGYLREMYRRDDGSIGYRCPGEPVDDYLRKGGQIEDTVGRKCVCNGLLATVGLGQQRGDGVEPAIVTAGAALADVALLLRDRARYSAADVVEYLTADTPDFTVTHIAPARAEACV
jgi:NAD(P)H-dependent flavin oxidoreductase YrpB (nitropropane dioxygenase family)